MVIAFEHRNIFSGFKILEFIEQISYYRFLKNALILEVGDVAS